MLYKLLSIALISTILWSCGESTAAKEPVTNTDVAQAFIDATLKMKVDEAAKYVLKDTAGTNMQYMEKLKEYDKRMSKEDIVGYSNASIIIKSIKEEVKDSVTIVQYGNSYKTTENNRLKLVRQNGQWLVDIQYTFNDTVRNNNHVQ
jgi:hypothetical protein